MRSRVAAQARRAPESAADIEKLTIRLEADAARIAPVMQKLMRFAETPVAHVRCT